MFFGYLGPLLTESGTVLAPRQRALLAVLLTRSGRPVAVDELAEFVWDGNPPARAADTLRTYVMRLRHSLGDPAGARIITRDPGYLIEATEDEVDARRFARACQDGSMAYQAGRWAAASAALAGGLALWRGEPLSDVPSQLLRDAEVPALHQQRLRARQWRIHADLQLGGGEELVAELQELTALEPLREQLAVLLMTALTRAGRASDALAVYQRVREALVGQLGIEPGAELREAQRLILAGEQPGPRPATSVSPGAPRTIPRQLPAAVGHFVGRSAELEELDAILGQAGTVTISSIGGMGGIGKTALALRWAHQVADRFPDGQLYVNLRGFGPAAPMTPADALRGFIDALRDPGRQPPADPGGHEAVYRSLTADRRILVILDNARNEQQVRPLLPGSPGSLTLITSRSQLTGLVATSGAIPLSLDPLTADEARELLTRRLGPQRLAAEPAAVEQLISACTGLPLALSIAAARAALTPKLALTVLSEQLGRSGLDALSSPDPYADLRSVFSWSCRRLSPEAARLFRCLSLVPGPDFSMDAAASIDPVGPTGNLLAELTGAHLVEEYLPGRFRLHDLLARYAQECSARDDDESARRVVRSRVLTWYSAAAATAARIVDSYRRSIPDLGQPDPFPAGLANQAQALQWLETERRNLVAAAEAAARHGFDSVAIALPLTLWTLFSRTFTHDLLEATVTGIETARRTGDVKAEAHLHRCYFHASLLQGRPEQGLDGLRIALAVWQDRGDLTWQADARRALSICYYEMGLIKEAIGECEQTVELARMGGSRRNECAALSNLGKMYQSAGQFEQALSCYLAAGKITEPEDPVIAGTVQVNLAELYLELGRTAESMVAASAALELSEQAGSRPVEAEAHRNLGEALDRTGRHADAYNHWRFAHAAYQELRDPRAAETAARLARGNSGPD